MAEKGIDIAAEEPTLWTPDMLEAADVVITMGCGDACPILPGRRYEDWVLADPAELTVGEVRPIRDESRRWCKLSWSNWASITEYPRAHFAYTDQERLMTELLIQGDSPEINRPL